MDNRATSEAFVQAFIDGDSQRMRSYLAADVVLHEAAVLPYGGDHVGVEGFFSSLQTASTSRASGPSRNTRPRRTSTARAPSPSPATGETYCLAHHLLETGEGRTLIVMSIRYEDTFVKHDGTWLFAERKLIIDWTDTRPSQP